MLKFAALLGSVAAVSGTSISRVTCTGSSNAYSYDFTCNKAIDGVLGTSFAINPDYRTAVGSWVTVQLIATRTVYGLRLMHRQNLAATTANKDILVEFSDGTSETVTMTPDEGVQELLFDKGHTTQWCKLTVQSVYADGLNGFAEINVITNPLSYVGASSVYSAAYRGANAVDDTALEWASSREGAGNWIQVQLSSQGVVAGVYLKQRAGWATEANKDVEFTFDDGSKQQFTVAQNGDVQFFPLQPAVSTQGIKIETLSVYGRGNNGWQEINIAMGELNEQESVVADEMAAEAAGEWQLAMSSGSLYMCKGDSCFVNSMGAAKTQVERPDGVVFQAAEGFSATGPGGETILGSADKVKINKPAGFFDFPFECTCSE